MVTFQTVQCRPGLTYTFLVSDIRALWRSGLRAGVAGVQKFNRCRLADLDGTEHIVPVSLTCLRL